MKRLMITADDFGLCSEVNQAVLRGHTEGILTAASLMMAAPATKEAVGMAKDHPTLKVGLHFVCVDGFGLLSPKPFSSHLVWAGVKYFFSPAWRGRLRKELEAQLEAFLKTGLICDHFNAHNHFHLHPVVRDIIVDLALKHGICKVRWPSPLPWSGRLKSRLDRTGLKCNDHTFGLKETGQMTEEVWMEKIPQMGEGLTEAYCHPAVAPCPTLNRWLKGYDCVGEFKALISPRVKRAIEKEGIERC